MLSRRESAGTPWPATVGRSKGSHSKVLVQSGRSPMLKHDAAPEGGGAVRFPDGRCGAAAPTNTKTCKKEGRKEHALAIATIFFHLTEVVNSIHLDVWCGLCPPT